MTKRILKSFNIVNKRTKPDTLEKEILSALNKFKGNILNKF
jgi:hypothetical protein